MMPRRRQRGAAIVAVVIVLVVVNLVVLGIVVGGARDQDLAARRTETVRAFYAAEGGMNMALREIAVGADEDGDGGIGSISDDANDANDPTLVTATVTVALGSSGSNTVLTADAESGETRRQVKTLVSPSSGGAGLEAERWSGLGVISTMADIDFDVAADATVTLTNVNFAEAGGALWPGGPSDGWAYRITGNIAIETAGTWTFTLESSDGSQLWIDDVLVVDHDGTHAMTSQAAATSLTAGSHTFEIRWFDNSGNHGLIASWSGPGVPSTTVIPASAFSH